MTRYGADSLGEPEAVNGNHPKWRAPTAVPVEQQDVLRMNNTLTGRMDEFIPQKGRQVRWYNCGPTVYDVSHMGHARTYLTFDIIRRIMEDYFNLDVVFQTNITDVDDKIILRSRCNELVRQYKEAKHPFEKVSADVQSAVEAMHKGLETKVADLTIEVAALSADNNSKAMAGKCA
jgi:cysteinyl-tRNA synthetase